jgi:hypothetical protein
LGTIIMASATKCADNTRVIAAEFPTHSSIYAWARTVAPDLLIFHPANGGWRSKAEGGRLKALGVTPGIPDLCLIAPVGRVFFIEVKTPRGKLSPDQRKIHEWLTAIGAPCAVCRSIDDARRALAAWGIRTREHHPLGHLDFKTRQAWRDSAVEWRAERDKTEQGG